PIRAPLRLPSDIQYPRPPLGRSDRAGIAALKPENSVTSRIQRQYLPMVGATNRAGSASILTGSPGNGVGKAPSGGVEWRPTRQVDAQGTSRYGDEQQIAAGLIPVYFGPADRLKRASLLTTAGQRTTRDPRHHFA